MKNFFLILGGLVFSALLGSLLFKACSKRRSAPIVQAPVATSHLSPTAIALEKELGLQKKFLPHDAKNLYLDVVVDVMPRCSMGDLDVIQFELRYSTEKRMLLSLESIAADDRSFKPMVLDVSEAQLSSGLSHQFVIPRPASPLALGIYLCKDSDKTNRCAGKTFADLNRLWTFYSVGSGPPLHYRAPDEIYYFQLLQFDGDDTVAAFDDWKMDRKKSQRLTEYFNSQYGGGAEARKRAEHVANLTNLLASVPVVLAQSLRIDLPKWVDSQCRKAPRWEGKRPPGR